MVPDDALLEHPVVPSVKIISAVPVATPVTTPPLSMVATVASLLDQVPPVVGDSVTVSPSHISLSPAAIVTVGVAFRVIVKSVVLEHWAASAVNVYVVVCVLSVLVTTFLLFHCLMLLEVDLKLLPRKLVLPDQNLL